VAFDARHNVWMISSLGISGSTVDVLVSRSTDGGLTWSNPVIPATGANDKNWTVCDDTSTSPHYGNCYTEYDITSAGDSIRMRTSTNGGANWGAALAPGGSHTGLGGQPVVLPNGDVVVPYESLAGSIRSFRSTNGGSSAHDRHPGRLGACPRVRAATAPRISSSATGSPQRLDRPAYPVAALCGHR
jgi:hypothetical protein